MTPKITYQCSQCGKKYPENRIFIIDGEKICASCIFGSIPPVEIYPIGFVKNELQRSSSDFGLRGKAGISKIELLSSQKRFMYKLADEKFLTIVYYLHKSRPVRSIFKRGLDGKKVGVFATRTPDRLSKIGIQDVKLIRTEETALYVEGLDAINGTPVLDIKMRWHKTYS